VNSLNQNIRNQWQHSALWMLLLLLATAWPMLAHTTQVEPIIVGIRPQKTFLTVEMRGNGEDIIQAVKVLDAERRGNDFTSAVSQRLQKYFDDKLLLEQGGQKLSGKIVRLDYWRPDDFDYKKSKFEAVLRYERAPALATGAFKVSSSLFDYLPNAQTILSVGGVQKVLQTGKATDFEPSAVTANLWGNIRDFAWMGIEHIFTGPDHMLFIVALLLISTSFRSLVKTLTGFTIAHSITLILSALSVIVLDTRLVDILIALSIIYVGLENIYSKSADLRRFWLAAAFGLIHGFGFSYSLREIGLPEEGLAWCLLSFNLGVEIAQVLICAVTFPILLRVKSKFERQSEYGGMDWPQAMHIASWCIVAAGSYWMIERLSS